MFLRRNAIEMTVQLIVHSRRKKQPQWVRWEDGTCPAWLGYICIPRNKQRKEGCLTPPWTQWDSFWPDTQGDWEEKPLAAHRGAPRTWPWARPGEVHLNEGWCCSGWTAWARFGPIIASPLCCRACGGLGKVLINNCYLERYFLILVQFLFLWVYPTLCTRV